MNGNLEKLVSSRYEDIWVDPGLAPGNDEESKIEFAAAFLRVLEGRRDNIVACVEALIGCLGDPDKAKDASDRLAHLDVTVSKTDHGWNYKLGSLR
jgi:hypothetical protein